MLLNGELYEMDVGRCSQKAVKDFQGHYMSLWDGIEVLVQEKAEEQFAEETEKKPEEAQKPVKKILYPEAWAYNFGESTNRMVFLQRVSYKGNWDILRPARTVEGMEIITREVLNALLESAEKLIDKMRCANYA